MTKESLDIEVLAKELALLALEVAKRLVAKGLPSASERIKWCQCSKCGEQHPQAS